MELSSEELLFFNTNGYLIIRDFLDSQSCNRILAVAQKHLFEEIEPIELEVEYHKSSKEKRRDEIEYINEHTQKSVIRRLRQVYDRDALFASWMKNEKIRPILKQILKETPVLITAHHNSIMTKMPHHSTQTSWHQDFRYWSYQNDNLVSVWLALEDENSQNGALEFIPKSHTMHFSKEQFIDKEYFSTTHPKNKELFLTKISTALKKGDIIIFHCKLLHRANKNKSSRPKLSFVYTVKGASNKVIKDTRSSSFKEIKLS